MAKTLLGWMRELSGNAPSRPEPAQEIRDNAVGRLWPYLRIGHAVLLVAAGVGGRSLASAKLVNHDTLLRIVEGFAALTLAFYLADYVLQRMKLVAKAPPSTPPEPDIGVPVFRRPPPPVRETATDRARVTRKVGGAIPPERSGRGQAIEWRLEGGYVWKRPGDEGC
jgi:hypothetical protein